MTLANIPNSLEIEFGNKFSKDLEHFSKFKNSLIVLHWQIYSVNLN
jgi:hypothetical protein